MTPRSRLGFGYNRRMAAVVIHGVTKQFGTQMVLENASLELNSGETVGLVGPNGAGKTTLFRLIVREFEPDLGTITRARGVEIGYLKQEPAVELDRTLHEEVGSVFADLLSLEGKLHAAADRIAHGHDDPNVGQLMENYDRINTQFIAAGGHTFETRLNEILGGLGFSNSDHVLPMSVLSGGQRCRAALAKLLLEDKPLLLLDEPTNHLDIDSVRWLEKFLTGHHGGAVVISHDRYLLDRLCTRIVEVAHRRLSSFPGNYTNYAQTKAMRELTQQREFEKHSEFIAKERDYIAKHLAGQRSQQAKGRRTRLERQLKDGEFVTQATDTKRRAKIAFTKDETKEGTILRCDDLAMVYGDNRLFCDLSIQVPAGDRLGITGPNGTGKTTLLKILLGEVKAAGGTIELTPRLRVGYYSQDHAGLDGRRTIVDEIRAVRPEFSEQDARSFLGRFLFTGNDAFKALGLLSGGEQSRVRLATLMLTGPDLLVLDEPTNHLDIPSREVLEEALREFNGTIIAVSHDRYFLDRVVNRLLVIRPKGHALYAGNYSYYLDQIETQRAADRADSAHPRKKKAKGKTTATPQSQSASSPYDHLSIMDLEVLVMEKEVQLAALNDKFGDPAVCKNPEALMELQEEVEFVSGELAAIDAAWQERVDAQ